MTDLADTLIIEEGNQNAMIVTLDKPMSLVEVWQLFVDCCHRPLTVTFCYGVARVIL